jgi:hypothetical protein
MKFNDTVSTPLGDGILEGRSPGGELIVRLPLNDLTRPAISQVYGTIHAEMSGLYVFPEEQVKELVQPAQKNKSGIYKERRSRTKAENVPVPHSEGFTALVRRLYAEDAEPNEIYDYAVAHEKFKGDPGKARRYAIAVIKGIQKERRGNN